MINSHRINARAGVSGIAASPARLEQEHPPAKFTVEDAKRIRAEYVSKLRALREAA